jgi:DNA-binding SARP family transcriptional activator/WD40 repeat protein
MEFRVLGSVEAREDDRTLALGGPQQRRLLAVLLADAGSVVPVDRLIAAGWPGDTAPDRGVRTTRTYVSRLRRSLGDGFVITQEPGYLLDVRGARFDKATFENLVTEARAAAPAAPAVAVERYDEALAQWRGPAFAEFAHEWWAQPEAAGLEELRLVVVEERLDVLLALDRHAEAVPDLEHLTAEHPYRERFTAQLMVALYRTGREVEAHRAYQRLRSALAEDTGLEPSAELVQLDRSIAAGDPAIGGSVERRLRGYVVGELLGQGASGAVYRATQPGLSRDVALKVISAALADDPAFVRRFETEAQLVSRLEHPHVVPLYDFWREPGGAFLVFRLLRGGDAAEALVRDGPWMLDRLDRVIEQVGSALVAAHAAGVVHRDVKPGNILFDEGGNAYLADFGIARAQGSDDERDPLARTPSPLYASPEQMSEGRSTPRSDQYSLAATAWELLTGEAAFGGDDVARVLAAKLHRGLPSVRSRRPDVPAAVDVVLATAGAAHPEDRFATVADLLVAWRRARRAVVGARSTGDDDESSAPSAPSATAGSVVPPAFATANPYKGLRSFREADAIDFFGRAALVDQLADMVAGNRFVVVVGPSGSGKSSVVHAGLVPRLRADERVLVASMVPGADPLEELSVSLSPVATGSAPIEPAQLGAAGGIGRAVRDVAPEGGELVLVVDQLEELWTVSDLAQRDRLLAGLAQAVDDPGSALRVVATVRADFFDRPLQDATIGALVAAGTLGVTPLSAAELLEAVVEPAGRLGVQFAPGLAAELVADVVGRPASLPLLQFALTELYDRRDDTTVTTAAYRAVGGVAGAVSRRADEVYVCLGEDDQRAAHELFTRLVAVGERGTHTRRRVRLGELAHVPDSVIATFASNRLVTFDRDPFTREPTVELAHEALLVRWPRLQAWIDDDRQWLALRRHLSAAADAWDAGGRESGELYRGARLAAALDALDDHRGGLTERELDLLEASRAARDADAERQRRAHRRLRRLLVGVAGALVVALVAGTVAAIQQRRAHDSSTRAQAATYRTETGRLIATARSFATGDTPVAALLGLEADRRRGVDPDEAATALQQVLTAKPGFLGGFPTVGEYAFGLDGTTFVSRTAKGIEVYDVADHTRRARVDHPSVRGISGRRVATGGDGLVVETAGDRDVFRFRLPRLEPAGDPIVTPGSVNGLALSPNGTLVTGHPGGLVVVWDAVTGLERGRFRVEGDARRLDLSADGSRVAVLTDASAQVWDTNTGQRVGPAFSAGGSDVALSPNGQRVAVDAFGDGLIFDSVSGAQTATLQSHGDFLRFIDDDRVAHSATGAIRVAEVSTGAVLVTTGTTCGCDLALSPDGRTVATGLDGPGLYALDGRELLADALDAPVLAGVNGFSMTAISADGRRLSAAAFGGGTVVYERDGDGWRALRTTSQLLGAIQPDGRLFQIDPAEGTASFIDPATGATEQTFPGPGEQDFANLVGLSPNGRLEAYGGLDGSVTVVDTNAAAVVARLLDLQELNAGNGFPTTSFVPGARFSNDGRWLVAATWSGAAVAWDTRTWRRAKILEPAIADVDGAATPAFDPTGRFLAATRGRASIDLFDATTLAPIRSIPFGVQGLPYGATFDPTGQRLVVTLDTEGMLTYDVDTARRLGAPLHGDSGAGIVFLDPATMAISLAAQGRVLIWHLDRQRLETEACRAAGRNLTRDEWTHLGPAGQPYRLTCPQFGEPPDDPTLAVEQPSVSLDIPRD